MSGKGESAACRLDRAPAVSWARACTNYEEVEYINDYGELMPKRRDCETKYSVLRPLLLVRGGCSVRTTTVLPRIAGLLCVQRIGLRIQLIGKRAQHRCGLVMCNGSGERAYAFSPRPQSVRRHRLNPLHT
jgi:hypothetical protein